jgi:hypothetical protein
MQLDPKNNDTYEKSTREMLSSRYLDGIGNDLGMA